MSSEQQLRIELLRAEAQKYDNENQFRKLPFGGKHVARDTDSKGPTPFGASHPTMTIDPQYFENILENQKNNAAVHNNVELDAADLERPKTANGRHITNKLDESYRANTLNSGSHHDISQGERLIEHAALKEPNIASAPHSTTALDLEYAAGVWKHGERLELSQDETKTLEDAVMHRKPAIPDHPRLDSPHISSNLSQVHAANDLSIAKIFNHSGAECEHIRLTVAYTLPHIPKHMNESYSDNILKMIEAAKHSGTESREVSPKAGPLAKGLPHITNHMNGSYSHNILNDGRYKNKTITRRDQTESQDVFKIQGRDYTANQLIFQQVDPRYNVVEEHTGRNIAVAFILVALFVFGGLICYAKFKKPAKKSGLDEEEKGETAEFDKFSNVVL
jgi:hypothetical protein